METRRSRFSGMGRFHNHAQKMALKRVCSEFIFIKLQCRIRHNRNHQTSTLPTPLIQSHLSLPRSYKTCAHESGSSDCKHQSCVICAGLTPLATILSLISASLGAASTKLLFFPSASSLPLQSTSPAALARGHTMPSTVSESMVSDHTATSPPRTFLAASSERPAVGSWE